MDKNVFFTVIVPLMGMKQMAVLGISTPDDEMNYYSMLLELEVDEGVPMFQVIRIENICQACKAKKNYMCSHLLAKRPKWQSADRQKMIQVFRESHVRFLGRVSLFVCDAQKIMAADPDIYAREMGGLVLATGRRYLFERALVDAFEKRPRHIWDRAPDVLYVGIDPSGGGDLSHYAIVTQGLENSQHVVSVLVELSEVDVKMGYQKRSKRRSS